MSVATVNYDGSENFCIFSDPGIKLFGRDIPLKQEPSEEPSTISTVQLSSYQDDQADSLPHIKDCKQPMEIITCGSESVSCVEIGNISGGSSSGEASLKCGIPTHDTVHNKDDVQDLVMVEKTPKKPDKLLPCPRCNSLDTKFCYFNNYNVNQPRHFCRKCQRYWTAGGTLRNVPVGAGRRKNKHSTFHQKHSMVSDAVRTTSTVDMTKHRFGNTGSALCSFAKPTLHVIPLDAQALPTLDSPSKNSTILTFGQESPLCRSMAATTLAMQEAAVLQAHGGVHAEGAILSGGLPSVGLAPEQEDCALTVKNPPPSCQSNGPISSSSSIAVNMQEGQHTSNADSGSRRVPVGDIASPSIHVAAWQPGNNGMSKNLCNSSVPPPDTKNSATSSFSPLPPGILACNGAPGSFWPGFSWSFMHPALWGASPLEWAGPWTVPVYPPEAAAAAAAAAASFFPPYIEGSPPQKQQVVERSQPEKCLWVPKTLRIDDPLDAARSSIWTTLGLGDGPLSSPAHGPTNAFQTKPRSKDNNESEAVSANRLSNPAALSRSAAFQENS